MATATRGTAALPRRSGPPIAPRKPMVSESGVNASGASGASGVSGPKKTQLGVAPSLPPPLDPVDGATTLAMSDEQLAQVRGLRDEASGERVRADVSPMTQRMPSLEEQSGEKALPATAPLAKPIAAPFAGTVPLEKPLADMLAKKLSEASKDHTLALKPSSLPAKAPGTSIMPPRPQSQGPSPIPAPRTPMVAMAPLPALPLIDSYATNKQPQHHQKPSGPPPPLQLPSMQLHPSAPPPRMPHLQQQMPSRPPPAALQTGPNPPSADPSEGDRPTFHVYSPHEIQSRQKLPTLTGIAEIPVSTPMHKMTGLKIISVVVAVCLVVGTVAAGLAVAAEDKPVDPASGAVPPTAALSTANATAPGVPTNAPTAVAPPGTPQIPPVATVKPLKPNVKPVKPVVGPGKPPTGPLPNNPYGK